MSTINQSKIRKRRKSDRRSRSPSLKGCPQKKGICTKVFIEKPKKPNSASRKCCKVIFFSTKQTVRAYIPGIGHNIQEHNIIIVQGGRIPDLVGMRLRVIRGSHDVQPVFERRSSRSKYGLKNFRKIKVKRL